MFPVRQIAMGALLSASLLFAQDTPPVKAKDEVEQKRSPLWSAVPSTGGDLPSAMDVAKDKASETGKKKKNEFLFAPIPMINPTLGNGLGFVAGYLYSTDPGSPPSMSGLGAFRTSNGSWGVGALQKLHLKKDRLRITVGAGYLDLNYKFFGIGAGAGNAGEYLLINQNGWGFLTEGLLRIHGKWYVGPRYMLMRSRVGPHTGEEAAADAPPLPAVDLKLRTASLGPHLQRDSRDNEMYPRAGSLFNTQAGFYGKAVGGNRTYQSYQISLSKYMSVGKRQVLAVRGSSCFTSGAAPFYDLCGFQSKDVRGYAAGRYLDRYMLASQAEFRQELPYRLGFVVFGGAGGVAPELGAFQFNELRPGVGVGVRFRVTKQNHINLTADYARGIGSSAFYVSVGEVF